MMFAPRDRRTLMRLLGEYQGLLESSIDGLLVCGEPPADDDDSRQLAEDRRNWKAAERMVKKLEAMK